MDRLEKLKELRDRPRDRIFWNNIMIVFSRLVLVYFGVTLTMVQRTVALEYIQRSVEGKRHTIVIAICRQVGKTELIVMLEWFLSYLYPALDGENYGVAMTAPEKGTGSEVFKRTKDLFEEQAQKDGTQTLKISNEDRMETMNGSVFEVYGLFKTYSQRENKKSTKEGRTFNKLVRDEMHLGDDEIYKDELIPTLATTGGVDVLLGNGGFRQCMGKKLSENGDTNDTTVYRLNYRVMREQMIKEFEKTKEKRWMRWVESQDKYIEDEGEENELVRKNLFCEWLVEKGNFISKTQLEQHRNDEPDLLYPSNYCDIGIDWGKKSDRTVVTITDVFCNVRAWGEFRGDYMDQVVQIAAWLEKERTKDDIVDYHLKYGTIYCDGTGSGDPVVEMLQKQTRIPIIPVVFGVKNKDRLARRFQWSLKNADLVRRFSYPTFDPNCKKFVSEMLDLEKEIRRESEFLNYKHPNRANAHDDFTDSTFLSLFGIMAPNKTNVFSDNAIE